MQQLLSVGIQHGYSAGVRKQINALQKQFHDSADILAGTGADITNEKDLRLAVLKRCPYYFDLKDVMIDRPSVRPKITSDDLDTVDMETSSEAGYIL